MKNDPVIVKSMETKMKHESESLDLAGIAIAMLVVLAVIALLYFVGNPVLDMIFGKGQ